MKQESPAPIVTRRSLLSRIKQMDDGASWQDFYNTYGKLIHSVALKSGLSDSEANDVVQETLVTVAKRIPGFRYDPSVGSFKGWLLTIVRWRIADQFRKRLPAQCSGTPSDTDDARRTAEVDRIPVEAQLEAVWDEEWKRSVVEAVMERVKAASSPQQFQVFDLYVRQKWPVRRICETLNITPTQVYLAKHRLGKLVKKESKAYVNGAI